MITRAAFLTGLGVALGAFGAHGLRPMLETSNRIDDWKTAVLYHLVHAVALFALGVWLRVDATAAASAGLRRAGLLWIVGVVCFSGSLYALGLGVPSRVLWPVTPFGGVCFLAGWGLLGWAAMRLRAPGTVG